VTILNGLSISSRETEVRNGINSWKVHQLNGRKLLVVFNPAISEGLQLYKRIQNLKISNDILKAISLNTFVG
jgi:hypothetical protein